MGIHVYNTQIFRQTCDWDKSVQIDERLFSDIYSCRLCLKQGQEVHFNEVSSNFIFDDEVLWTVLRADKTAIVIDVLYKIIIIVEVSQCCCRMTWLSCPSAGSCMVAQPGAWSFGKMPSGQLTFVTAHVCCLSSTILIIQKYKSVNL